MSKSNFFHIICMDNFVTINHVIQYLTKCVNLCQITQIFQMKSMYQYSDTWPSTQVCTSTWTPLLTPKIQIMNSWNLRINIMYLLTVYNSHFSQIMTKIQFKKVHHAHDCTHTHWNIIFSIKFPLMYFVKGHHCRFYNS